MLQKKLCLVVTFDATAAAMAAEKYCLERGVPGRLIPVPREITAGCGLAWKAEVDQEEAVTAADKAVIYPGEGGRDGCAVYGCLFLGKGAYGVVDLSEGTEVIVKPRGSSGTADPLDQRSSVGWKGIHAAAILYDEYMVRVECGSSYSGEDKAN